MFMSVHLPGLNCQDEESLVSGLILVVDEAWGTLEIRLRDAIFFAV